MGTHIVILGAGFGGLELATTLSQELGDAADVTLIDKARGFAFGFSKLDVLFGSTSADDVLLSYDDVSLPGVTLLRETVIAIDPERRTVTTNAGGHEADVLVVALGADYDVAATRGLAEHGREFYSMAGAAQARADVTTITEGRIVIGICDAPYKCPPAPAECALLLHAELERRGVRDACDITLTSPLPSPVPPSPETSAAILAAFEERDIGFLPGVRVTQVGPDAVALDDGVALPSDLFLGVPKHRAPDAVAASGMTEDGYIPVDSATLATRWPGVYAVGDCATVGVPKAGVFAEGAARVVAATIIAAVRGTEPPPPYAGQGQCYLEFGDGIVARVDVDFLGGPKPTGRFTPPSDAIAAEKVEFGASRRARWFGRSA
jgi:sulfide:quinone oxidoreductase